MNKLPLNWINSTLGEITSQGQYGWTTKSSENGEVKYLRTTDITSGSIHWETVPYCQQTPDDLDKYNIDLNDILISRAGSVGFSILIEDVPSFPVVFASYLIRFKPDSNINSKFISRFLQSDDYWQQISEASAGIALANVNAKKLANVIVPIAPLSEQARIIEKLDVLLARVDACREHLDRVPAILKRFRQAVFAEAVSGRLTEEWRSQNDRSIIDWGRFKVREVFNSYGGGTPSKTNQDFWDGNIGWLSSGDIKSSIINYSSETITLEGLENSAAKIAAKGSVIVVVRSGILKHTFPVAVLSKPFAINQDIKCFDSGDENLNKWLAIYWQAFQKDILAKNREGTTVQSVKYETLLNWEILLPTLEERKEIFRRIEKILNITDKLETHFLIVNNLVNNLTLSLLSKAFRGGLVPQDSNDEPAEQLLERIREEKLKTPQKTKRTQRRSDVKNLEKNLNNTRISVLEALIKSEKELSSEQLFIAAGYSFDSKPDLVEEFFIDIRESLKNLQIKRRRIENEDWFTKYEE